MSDSQHDQRVHEESLARARKHCWRRCSGLEHNRGTEWISLWSDTRPVITEAHMHSAGKRMFEVRVRSR